MPDHPQAPSPLGQEVDAFDEATVHLLEAGIYVVAIEGYFGLDLASRAVSAIRMHASKKPYAIIYVLGENFDGYESSLRETDGPHLSGLATAIVTQRALMRVVVSTMGLAFLSKGRHIKGFDALDEARVWVRGFLA